jgi:uncharacterized protein YqfB (UPF0267 family)
MLYSPGVSKNILVNVLKDPGLVSLDQLIGVGAVVTEQHAGPDVILLDQVRERDIYPVVVYFYVVRHSTGEK